MKIPPEAIASLKAAQKTFEEACAKMQDPNCGKADSTAKNDARKVYETEIRGFIKDFRYNPSLTDEEDQITDEIAKDATEALVEINGVKERFAKIQENPALNGAENGFTPQKLETLGKLIDQVGVPALAGDEISNRDTAGEN